MSDPDTVADDSSLGSSSSCSSSGSSCRSVRKMTSKENSISSPRWLPELLPLRQRHRKGDVSKVDFLVATPSLQTSKNRKATQLSYVDADRITPHRTTRIPNVSNKGSTRKQQSSSPRHQWYLTSRPVRRTKQLRSRTFLDWLVVATIKRRQSPRIVHPNKTAASPMKIGSAFFMLLVVVAVVVPFQMDFLTQKNTSPPTNALTVSSHHPVEPLVFYHNYFPNDIWAFEFSGQDKLDTEKFQVSKTTRLLRGSTSNEPEEDSLVVVFPEGDNPTTSTPTSSPREQPQRLCFHLPHTYETFRRRRLQGMKGRRKLGNDYSPDFGGLEIDFSPSSRTARPIRTEKELGENEDEEKEDDDYGDDGDDDGADKINSLKRMAAHYALDDDYQQAYMVMREPRIEDDDEQPSPSNCRNVQEYRHNFPTCNELHQLDRSGGNVMRSDYGYINSGYFRDVFSFTNRYAGVVVDATDTTIQVQQHLHQQNHPQQGPMDKIAIKQILFEDTNAQLDYYEYIRIDALVAERLTASPRTFDIYGYCGLSILSEYFYHRDIEEKAISNENDGWMDPSDLEDEEDVDPQNDLTPEQKLVLALDMAEGLADLHGYAGGLIIHDDVQMSQFLLNKDKTRLKLNDFNRAVLPLWDDSRQAYCLYRNGRGRGYWRSPEEYKNEPLTDAIDIWSLGNNLYGLLTGLNPLYDHKEEEVPTSIADGETGYIDPRYFQRTKAEHALATVIQKCYKYPPEDRPSVFEVVQELDRAVSEILSPLGISRASVLQGL